MKSLNAAIASALTPPENLTVAEWADKYRVLSSAESGEPGRWRTDRVPYLRYPMECLTDSETETVVLEFPSQVGKSEVANNFIGEIIHLAPGPILMIQPTGDMAKHYSQGRVDRLIESTSVLNGLVKERRSRDSVNTINSKEFPGGVFYIRGSNSPTALASTPIEYLLLDEVDRFPLSAGDEGDPISLARMRTETFARRKILITSTPTLKDVSRVQKEFDKSLRHDYHVPCPHCGGFFVMTWQNLHWDEGLPETAEIVCPLCGCYIEHRHKLDMLLAGKWIPREEDIRAGKDGLVKGFHLNALYSPFTDWARLAREFLEVHKDPVRFRVFVNTRFAEVWDDNLGERVKPELVASRASDWNDVPAGIGLVTCGADVQDDRIELEIVGWGRDYESWSLDYIVEHGDPSGRELWEKVDKIIRTKTYDGLPIGVTCIDSGGHYAQQVQAFAFARGNIHVYAIKGSSDENKPVWNPKPSKAKGGLNVYFVGVSAAKFHVMQRLKVETPGPSYCHFPAGRDASYFSQLTAETLKIQYAGGREKRIWWKPEGRRNEALDCRVYAYAAFMSVPRREEIIEGNVIQRAEKAAEKRKEERAKGVVRKPLQHKNDAERNARRYLLQTRNRFK